MQLYKVAKSDGRTKSEGLTKRSKEKVTTYYGLSKTPSYPAIQMARLTRTKMGTEIMWYMHYLCRRLTKEVYLT